MELAPAPALCPVFPKMAGDCCRFVPAYRRSDSDRAAMVAIVGCRPI